MNKKDSAAIKVLTQLGLRKQPQLTPEQEQQLTLAQDPGKQFLNDVEKLFKDPKSVVESNNP